MDKIEQIRQEIKRRRLHFNEEAEKYQALNNGYSQNCYGARDALRDLENFLDTLSEELNRPEPYNPVYDEDYLNEKIAKATKSWEGVNVDKMLAECRGYDEEPDKSLEEAAEEYGNKEHPDEAAVGQWGTGDYEPPVDREYLREIAKDAFIAGAEWQKNKDKETIEVAEDHAFMAGSVWQEEQMLKKAIEGVARPDDCEIWVNLVGYGYKFNDGDKVKIIIVPEKEK